jgi:excisionase family DNA binding protein
MNLQTDAPAVNGTKRPSERTNTGAGSDGLLKEIARLQREIQALRKEINDPDAPKLLSVEEVSEYLNLSERSVRSLIAGDELQSIKVKRRRLVPVSALEDFVQKRLGG